MNIGAYIELLRTHIRDYKTQIVADVMALDAKQTVKFWPVYKEFEAEYSAVGDKIIAAVKAETPLQFQLLADLKVK